jgi:predicted nucleic acid-binding Zn ribbon protein
MNRVEKYRVSTTCSICGKPLTHTTDEGMFCDDECEMETQEEREEHDEMFRRLVGMFCD